ncbi:MAG: glycosyl-4,4'-diaponeurosporenoate acyltransferase CrtO family protein [Anaerolineae bacterium]
MRLVTLPTVWTVALDFVAWFIIHLGVAYLSLKLPDRLLDHHLWLYRSRPWERGGSIYQRLLHVRRWKRWLPDGAALFGRAVDKRIRSRRDDHLETWILESCRAELCHWMAIAPALLFFLWNPPGVGVFMVVYAIGFNTPCIIAQRYNRPRVLRTLARQPVVAAATP